MNLYFLEQSRWHTSATTIFVSQRTRPFAPPSPPNRQNHHPPTWPKLPHRRKDCTITITNTTTAAHVCMRYAYLCTHVHSHTCNNATCTPKGCVCMYISRSSLTSSPSLANPRRQRLPPPHLLSSRPPRPRPSPLPRLHLTHVSMRPYGGPVSTAELFPSINGKLVFCVFR